MSDQRPASTLGHLARRGFADPAAAHASLESLGLRDADPLLDALAAAADPDQALTSLSRLSAVGIDVSEVVADPDLLASVVAVTGMSTALAEHLVRHPQSLDRLRGVDVGAPGRQDRRERLLLAVGADPASAEPRAARPDAADALRVAYRDELLTTVVRDLVHDARVDDIAEELADLADAALEAGLAIARAELPGDAVPCRLAIIAMGKCGGRELNYVSDVDVIFVAEPAEVPDRGGSADPPGLSGALDGRHVVIVGDVLHSRVARSNVLLLHTLGARVTLVAPPTLMPVGVDTWPCEVSYDLDDALPGADAVMMLRVQAERMNAAYFPTSNEYSRRYGLDVRRAGLLADDGIVLHPGPMNRGMEISAEVADGPRSVIVEQVTNGVHVRMAVLYLLLGAAETHEEADAS